MKTFFIAVFLFFFSIVSAAADIAVIKPYNSCRKDSVSYAASLGNNVVRWLKKGGVECDVIDERNLNASIYSKKLIFIFLCSDLKPAQLAVFRKYVSRGGKICSFYGEDPSLAALLEVGNVQYMKARTTGQFSKMVFRKGALSGAPAAVSQDNSGIFYASPAKGAGSVVAYWKGSSSSLYPALIKLRRGWWFTGILKGKGDELRKEQLLLSVVDSVIPGRWKRAQWAEKKNRGIASARAIGMKQVPRPGEIHAVWDHSGEGLYPGNWPKTIRTLKARGITDVFVNVAGPGFAHYNSKLLPRSNAYLKRGDQLAACIKAAHGSGIKVHAWILCFSSARSSPSAKANLVKKGWVLKNPKGGYTDYLDASNPALQKLLLNVMAEIKNTYRVDGIHLDFVRWSEVRASLTSTSAVMARYNAQKSRFGNSFNSWKEYQIRKFVYSSRMCVKKNGGSRICFSTAVMPMYPSCVMSVGQNWISWMDKGYVDYIVPMNYTQNVKQYSQFLSVQAGSPSRAKKVISGIGVTANESRLGVVDVINQVNIARSKGAAGVALFDLNETLANEILPVLSLKMFR